MLCTTASRPGEYALQGGRQCLSAGFCRAVGSGPARPRAKNAGGAAPGSWSGCALRLPLPLRCCRRRPAFCSGPSRCKGFVRGHAGTVRRHTGEAAQGPAARRTVLRPRGMGQAIEKRAAQGEGIVVKQKTGQLALCLTALALALAAAGCGGEPAAAGQAVGNGANPGTSFDAPASQPRGD